MIIRPPAEIQLRGTVVFLAGSIEMGSAERWQDRVCQALIADDVTVLNPRRDDWDSSWVQSIEDASFRDQVDWELAGLSLANVIAMYLAPGTQSPISLLELGLYAASGKLIVCCPEGFWRKGNVDIVCQVYGVEQAKSLDDLVDRVKARLGMQEEGGSRKRRNRCCYIGCDKDAVWGISSQSDPYDDTHACQEHLAALADTFGGESWFELYRLSAVEEGEGR